MIDRDRLVETASAMIDVHSFTGDEARMADSPTAANDVCTRVAVVTPRTLTRAADRPWCIPRVTM